MRLLSEAYGVAPGCGCWRAMVGCLISPANTVSNSQLLKDMTAEKRQKALVTNEGVPAQGPAV